MAPPKYVRANVRAMSSPAPGDSSESAQRVIDFASQVWGPESYRTLSSLNDGGMLSLKLGNLPEAQHILQSALSTSLEVLGPLSDIRWP